MLFCNNTDTCWAPLTPWQATGPAPPLQDSGFLSRERTTSKSKVVELLFNSDLHGTSQSIIDCWLKYTLQETLPAICPLQHLLLTVLYDNPQS